MHKNQQNIKQSYPQIMRMNLCGITCSKILNETVGDEMLHTAFSSDKEQYGTEFAHFVFDRVHAPFRSKETQITVDSRRLTLGNREQSSNLQVGPQNPQ